MVYSGKYTDLEWTEAPGHPALLYAEDGDVLILKYFKSYITTNWDSVERVIDLKNQTCGKIRKPNPASVKRGLKRVVGEPANANRMNGARLFIRLVMEGQIQNKLSYVNDALGVAL